MLVKAGSAHGDLVVSKYRLRQVEGVALVRSKRDAGQQAIGFTSRPFVLCGLPLRRPPGGVLKHERRNGRFTLQVVGHPDFGLPFGQDRLVPIFLATQAVRQKSPIVRFSGGQEVLDMFGLARGGKEYRRMARRSNASSVPRSSSAMSPAVASPEWCIAQGSTSWRRRGSGTTDRARTRSC